jgi:uncharacterized protein GlcG (DUF336 family)
MPSRSWTLNSADVEFVIAAARRAAEEYGLSVSVAVVDQGGNLLALTRMDGAKTPSARVAELKAWTAALFQRATGDYQESTAPQGGAFALWNAFPGRMVPVPGGVPIWVNGTCVGGIGVSGGTGEQDAMIAERAVNRFDEHQEADLASQQ